MDDNEIGINAILNWKQKKYIHFDFPLSESERDKICTRIKNDPQKELAEHRYLPFISFSITFHKYNSKDRRVKNKKRVISLSSHHDAIIYQYYAAILNKYYDKYVNEHNIDEVSVAYRSGHSQSNIDIAKEVFDFTVNSQKSWIIRGDFEGFFDNLNHNVLSAKVAKVLGGELPLELKRMLISVMKYRVVTRDKLRNQLKSCEIETIFRHKYVTNSGGAYVPNLKDFGKLIKENKIRFSGKNRKGIPQGTAVSAVLANIYMIDLDQWLVQRVRDLNGIYRRYSDDFVIIIPKQNTEFSEVRDLCNEVIGISQKRYFLTIEKHKTSFLDYSGMENNIRNYDLEKEQWEKGFFDYLGFVFDGITVSLRPKSIYKFYYKGKRAVNRLITVEKDKVTIAKGISPEKFAEDYTVQRHINHEEKIEWRLANDYEKKRVASRLEYSKKMSLEQVRMIHKMTTIRYLSTEVKKPRVSMLGYAKRAQGIFESNSPQYRVKILEQVMTKLKQNQTRLGISRKDYRPK